MSKVIEGIKHLEKELKFEIGKHKNIINIEKDWITEFIAEIKNADDSNYKVFEAPNEDEVSTYIKEALVKDSNTAFYAIVNNDILKHRELRHLEEIVEGTHVYLVLYCKYIKVNVAQGVFLN
ncbi:MAG: hypothetical protein ACRC57_10330 [Sarcina sp.]